MSAKQAVRMAARNAYKTWTLHQLYPSRYRKLISKKNVNPRKVVFLEVRMDHLTDSFTCVWNALEKQGGWEMKPVFIEEGMTKRARVRENCLKALEDVADARYIFINDSCYFLSSLPLRKETEVIQLWHACGAFKKFGYSLTGKRFGSDKADLDRFPVHKNFTYVTVSSREVVWAYAQAFHMEERENAIVPTGISRTDIFFDRERIAQARRKLESVFPAAKGKKVILYAPTFRGTVADAASPDFLDARELHERLGRDDYVLLFKHHPFVKRPPAVPEACRGYARDVTEEMEIEQLLMVADVCISDYSSLIFEYSLFERPMLFLAPDLDSYVDWRGFYYPFEEMTPGPVLRSTEQVADCLAHLDERFDRARVAAFREKFMGACDGHATERVLELMR